MHSLSLAWTVASTLDGFLGRSSAAMAVSDSPVLACVRRKWHSVARSEDDALVPRVVVSPSPGR